jgi:hypothetical protein
MNKYQRLKAKEKKAERKLTLTDYITMIWLQAIVNDCINKINTKRG